jgi:hypothetical protein
LPTADHFSADGVGRPLISEWRRQFDALLFFFLGFQLVSVWAKVKRFRARATRAFISVSKSSAMAFLSAFD